MNRFIFLAFLFLLPVTALSEGVYKWTDENGRVHYGEKPPQGGTATIVNTPAEPPAKPSPWDMPPLPDPTETTSTQADNSSDPCMQLARNLLATPPGPAGKPIIAEMKAKCPNTRYECYFFKKNPEKNNCRSFPITSPEQGLVRGITYN